MPNVATALKQEIARVARKEIKAETAQIRKASVTYRQQISALRKKVEGLEKQLRQAGRANGRAASAFSAAESDEEDKKQLRFSATRFAAQRQKLGLSAAQMGTLVGASGQSVYKWEKGEVRPRRSQLEAISKVRGLGKK
jgi:DNA-binding transcriptional regulator YiaG